LEAGGLPNISVVSKFRRFGYVRLSGTAGFALLFLDQIKPIEQLVPVS
jgi:hypothetical protein